MRTSTPTHNPADVLDLYRQLKAAPADSEEFELLSAAFNRVCNGDPDAVVRALRLEAYTA